MPEDASGEVGDASDVQRDLEGFFAGEQSQQPVATTAQTIVRSGWLEMKVKIGWKKRWFVISDGMTARPERATSSYCR